MTEAIAAKPKRRFSAADLRFHGILLVLFLVLMAASTAYVYNEAVAEAREDGEEEIDFDIEDAYRYWALGIIFVTMAEIAYFGVRRKWTFATTVQIGLIILLVLSFALITQQIERDVFEWGGIALIVFTVLQIVFGNVNPEAGFGESMRGLVTGLVIISAIVALSIYLVPYLIELGR